MKKINKVLVLLLFLIICCNSQGLVTINQNQLQYQTDKIENTTYDEKIYNAYLEQFEQLEQKEQNIYVKQYWSEGARMLRKFLKSIESLVPQAKVNIGVGDGQIIDIAFDDKKPRLDLLITNSQNGNKFVMEQYGYSYWFRYLTRYPRPMFQGKNEDYYFMSRLTSNNAYSNIEYGDRLLALFQGQNGYVFCTQNLKNDNLLNLAQEIGYGDIEGVWTFMYFSYGYVEQPLVFGEFVGIIWYATGYLLYSGQYPPQSVHFDDIQQIQTPPFLRLIIGGADLNLYQSLNGQFTSPTMKYGPGAYINTLYRFYKEALGLNPEPNEGFQLNGVQPILQGSKSYDMNQVEVVEIATYPITKFPLEYGVYGWFRGTTMEDWHLAFRLHINQGQNNWNCDRLGDRTLAAWVSPREGGIHLFSTYSYDDLNGNGNPNKCVSVPRSQAALENWHFIFYAYNRNLRKIEGFVQFFDKKQTIIQENINHYLVAQMYINLGKDSFYPAWNGDISTVGLCLGKGASLTSFPQMTKIMSLQPSAISAFVEVTETKFELTKEKQPYETDDSAIPLLIGQNKRQQW